MADGCMLIMFSIVDLYSIDLFTALWQTFQLSTTSSLPSFLPQQIRALWTLCVHISTILMIQPPFISQLVLRCGHTRLLAWKIAFALTKNISDSQFVTFTSSLGQIFFLAFHKRTFCNVILFSPWKYLDFLSPLRIKKWESLTAVRLKVGQVQGCVYVLIAFLVSAVLWRLKQRLCCENLQILIEFSIGKRFCSAAYELSESQPSQAAQLKLDYTGFKGYSSAALEEAQVLWCFVVWTASILLFFTKWKS